MCQGTDTCHECARSYCCLYTLRVARRILGLVLLLLLLPAEHLLKEAKLRLDGAKQGK